MSTDDLVNVIKEVMEQNKDTKIQKGTTGVYQITGKVSGIEYVLGFKNGRVGQLYSK